MVIVGIHVQAKINDIINSAMFNFQDKKRFKNFVFVGCCCWIYLIQRSYLLILCSIWKMVQRHFSSSLFIDLVGCLGELLEFFHVELVGGVLSGLRLQLHVQTVSWKKHVFGNYPMRKNKNTTVVIFSLSPSSPTVGLNSSYSSINWLAGVAPSWTSSSFWIKSASLL